MRIELHEEALAAKLRVAGFHLGNHLLGAWRTLGEATGLDPAGVLILLTINNASIQRALRETGAGAVRKGGAIDERHFRPISRRAIALATGLSRETVRRKVRKLIEAGVVIEDGRGVKTMNVVANPQVAGAISELAAQHVTATNRLLAEGVLRGAD